MSNSDPLKTKLRSLAKAYAKNWKRLPRTIPLPEPLPVISKLYIDEGRDDEKEMGFVTPQDAIQAALDRGAKVVLIEAGPGQGKTSALLWAAHLACSALIKKSEIDPGCHLPWFKNLGLLIRKGDAQKTLKGILAERPKVMRDKPGLLYLDGLDLLTDSRPDPAPLVTAAISSADDDSHLFVFSGRPQSGILRALQERGTSYRIELAGLDQQPVDDWLKERPDLQATVGKICTANSAASELRQIPLLFAMVVSAALSTNEKQEPLVCNQHPGRAGLFAGFIDHFLKRAKEQGHLIDGYEYDGRVLEGLCWAALKAGHVEKIPDKELHNHLMKSVVVHGEAEQPMTGHEADTILAASVKALRYAGIILQAQNDRTIRFIHQEFMEHLGGRHLARRIKAAMLNGWLEAELWDHLTYKQLDNLLSHGLAQLKDDRRPDVMQKVFSLLANYGLIERASPLFKIDSTVAKKILEPFLVGPFLKEYGTPISEVGVGTWGGIKNPKAAGPRIEALEVQDINAHKAAARALGGINSPRASGPLQEAIKNQKSYVRNIAARALAKNSDLKAVELLIKALKDSHIFVRRLAAEELGKIKDPKAVGPLIEALKDKDKNIRRGAAKALGNIKNLQAVGPLIEALKDQDVDVRRIAADALGNINDPQAVGPLIEALKDQDVDARRIAADALGEIWFNIFPKAPMLELAKYANIIPIDMQVIITSAWKRRVIDHANLSVIEGQRLQRIIVAKMAIEEKAMGKGQDNINVTINAPNYGQIIAKQEGINIYNDPQVLLQAVATLRTDFYKEGIIKSQGATIDEALTKLDIIADALRASANIERIKGPWAWLQNTVNVAALSEFGYKAWEILNKALAQ